MDLTIPFGEGEIQAQVPDRTFVVPPGGTSKKTPPIADLAAAVDEALKEPLGLPPLSELAKPNARVTICFDDATVPCFSPFRGFAIKAVLGELQRAGVDTDTVKLICANSLHRQFRREELAVIIGQDLVDAFGDRLFCHDAEDPEQLVYLGKTDEHGYDVEVSRHVVESDLTVYISAAQGRGFSGGWKSVCVGMSTFRSIRHHHTPDGMSMSVKDNRMHRVLDEMGRHFEANTDTTVFKIDAVEMNPFQSSHVFAGGVDACRAAVLEVLADVYPPRRSLSEEKYDVVLYGVPDWSPYAIFSHMNPILTLVSSGLGYLGGTMQALGKPGCTVIMATPCPERWDDVHHPSYRDVWENVLPECRDPYEIEARYTEQYATNAEYIDRYRHHFAFHPVHGVIATHPLRRLKHAGRVIVAGIEDPKVATHLGFEAADSVERALDMAMDTHGANCSVVYAQHPASQATKVLM